MKTLGEELERDALARKWLVPGMLATGRVLLLYGTDLRTLWQFTADLTLAVARGLSLGPLKVPEPVPATVVCLRDGGGLPAVFRERGITPLDRVYRQSCPTSSTLVIWLESERVGRLVVIDNWEGLLEIQCCSTEWESTHAALGALRRYAQEHDCTVVVLHKVSKEGDEARGSLGVRGFFDGYASVRPKVRASRYMDTWRGYSLHVSHRDADPMGMSIETPKVELPQTDERAPEKGPYR